MLHFRLTQNSYYWIAVFCALLPALWAIFAYTLNHDIAWLAQSALRLIQGGSYFNDIYETNPPLSVLIYLPPALLWRLTGLPLDSASALYTLGLAFLSATAILAILRRLPNIDAELARYITVTWLIALIVLPVIDFGERDHLVLMGLGPLLALQLSDLQKNILPTPLRRAALTAGTLAILLKPPYIILPAAFWFYNYLRHRRPRALLNDPVLRCIGGGVMLYILVTALFFTSYFTHILPDVLTLYLPMRSGEVWLKTAFYGFLMLASGTFAFFAPVDPARRRLILLLHGAGLLCLLPYLLLGKDFWYQLLPALTFFFCGFCALFEALCHRFIPAARLRLVLPTLLSLALAYALTPPDFNYPGRQAFNDLDLTKIIKRCEYDCSFFMFNNNMGIMHSTAAYTGQVHASRFPALWFLPALQAKGWPEPKTSYYRHLIAEDFARYQPDTVLLGRFRIPDRKGEKFDFVSFFSKDDLFAQEWKNYQPLGRVDINRRAYHTGTALDHDDRVTYDIYVRK